MYSTIIYNYLPRQIVVVYNGLTTGRYQLVYAKNLSLHLGVDNKLQFQFINQDQKPVDITNTTVSIKILNYDNTAILMQTQLVPVLPLTGIAELQLVASDLLNIEAQMCHYSLTMHNGTNNLPLFTNEHANAQGTIEILSDMLPDHIPSTNITIPTYPQPAGSTVTFTSSTIDTLANQLTTLQVYYANYSGNILINGSTTGTSSDDWYLIQHETYNEDTSTEFYTIEGIHPYLQLKFNLTGGNVTQILAR